MRPKIRNALAHDAKFATFVGFFTRRPHNTMAIDLYNNMLFAMIYDTVRVFNDITAERYTNIIIVSTLVYV